jgi:hypothetical protein
MRNIEANARVDSLPLFTEPTAISDAISSRDVLKRSIMAGLSTVLLALSVVAATSEIYYFTLRAEVQKKRGAIENAQLLANQLRDNGRLDRYQWVTPSQGVLRIPLSLAKNLTISDYQKAPKTRPAEDGRAHTGNARVAIGTSP